MRTGTAETETSRVEWVFEGGLPVEVSARQLGQGDTVVRFTYDARGHVTRIDRSEGGEALPPAYPRRREGADGSVSIEIDEAGYEAYAGTWTFDEEGRVARIASAAPSSEPPITECRYDARGRPLHWYVTTSEAVEWTYEGDAIVPSSARRHFADGFIELVLEREGPRRIVERGAHGGQNVRTFEGECSEVLFAPCARALAPAQ